MPTRMNESSIPGGIFGETAIVANAPVRSNPNNSSLEGGIFGAAIEEAADAACRRHQVVARWRPLSTMEAPVSRPARRAAASPSRRSRAVRAPHILSSIRSFFFSCDRPSTLKLTPTRSALRGAAQASSAATTCREAGLARAGRQVRPHRSRRLGQRQGRRAQLMTGPSLLPPLLSRRRAPTRTRAASPAASSARSRCRSSRRSSAPTRRCLEHPGRHLRLDVSCLSLLCVRLVCGSVRSGRPLSSPTPLVCDRRGSARA